MQRYSIKDFDRQFPDDDACLDFLKDARWPKGITCEKCQRGTKHYRIASKKVYSCEYCGTQVSPTADTIFHKSSTSLRSWFYAIYVMAQTRTGISAMQLQRELGVTYKCAWRIFKQVRKLMDEELDPFDGQVEVDETYVGGKDKNRHKSKRSGKRGRGAGGKVIVMGVAQRKGKISAEVIPNVRAETLVPRVMTKVMPKATVFTDELASYNQVADAGYQHERVYHSAEVYVTGTAHVNTIEGFWSLVKRGIGGVHHSVGHHYLQQYLNSYTYRWNHRDDEQPMFTSLLNRVPSVLGTGTLYSPTS